MACATGSVLTDFTPTLILLAGQRVSDLMACAAGSVLTGFTPTLVLLA